MADFQKLIDKKDDAAKYMVDNITYMCKNLPKRTPGSDGEMKACEYIASELENNCGCKKASIEPFTLHPNAFYGWIYVTITLALIQSVLYFFYPLIGVILMVFGFAAMILEFILYKQAVDKLFPEKTSHNVTAIRPCTGEVKARVMFQGHIDAAWNWPVNEKLGGRAYVGHIVIAVVGVFYMFILSIVRAVQTAGLYDILTPDNPAMFYAGIASFIFLPFVIGMYFMWNEKLTVTGANDDLSGVLSAVGILHQLEEEGISLEHVEVGAVISGSEEAGLRGTKAWCKAHKDDYKDVPTYFFSFDTIYDSKDLIANYKDLNSTVTTDKALNDLFVDAADEMGVKIKKGALPFFGGSTDAAGFAQGGFRCAGITAMCQSPIPQFYHTVKDVPEILNPSCLADVYASAINCLKKIDEKTNNGEVI